MTAHPKDGGPAITDSDRLAFMISASARVFQFTGSDRWSCAWFGDDDDVNETMMHKSAIEAIDAAMLKAREVGL